MIKKITPHKGGRTAALFVRIKPEALDKLKRLAQKAGKSQADIIEELIDKTAA